MNTNEHELVFKNEVFQIAGCAMSVLNTLGHGLPEKLYENALIVEMTEKGIPFQQQPRFPVLYKTVQIGEFIPDVIAFNQLVVETKTIDRITRHEEGQIINYLKITNLKVGLILNFRHSRLEWKRIVL